jgi:quinol monooxygenase YgiN
MIIVSGRIYVRPGARQGFLTSSAEAVAQARRAPGCRDFVVAADPLEPDRVNVYEEWESEEALLAFRGDGPDQDVGSSILRADVFRHVISSTGPA